MRKRARSPSFNGIAQTKPSPERFSETCRSARSRRTRTRRPRPRSGYLVGRRRPPAIRLGGPLSRTQDDTIFAPGTPMISTACRLWRWAATSAIRSPPRLQRELYRPTDPRSARVPFDSSKVLIPVGTATLAFATATVRRFAYSVDPCNPPVRVTQTSLARWCSAPGTVCR